MAESLLPSSGERAVARELASLRAEIERVKSGNRSTQLDFSSIMAPLFVRDPVTGEVVGAIGPTNSGGMAVMPVGGPPPPKPNSPTMTPITAGVDVGWNGEFVGGAEKPANFGYVAIHASGVGPNFITDVSNLVGVLYEKGSVPVAPVSGPLWARLVPHNNSTPSVSGEASDTATATALQVVAQAVLDGIVNEVALANQAVSQIKVKLGAVGTAQIAGNAVTLSQLADGSVNATKLINGAVTTAAIAPLAVTTAELAANSVVAGKIAASTITATELGANSVTASELAAEAVVAGKIAANAVTAGSIAALAVTAGSIATNAVTAGSISAGAVTAAKLEANLVMATRLIAGSLTGTRAEMNGSGFEAWAGTLQTFDVNASNGDVMMLGTYRSAAIGTARVEIVKSGSLRFFDNGAGTGTYGEIFNNGGDLRLRGEMNGSNAGNIAIDSLNAGFNYGVPGGNTLTGVGVSGNFYGVLAAFSGHRLNGRVAPDGNGRRAFFLHTNSSGTDIGSLLLQYGSNGESTPRPVWHAPTNGSAITFGANEIWVANNSLQGFGPIAASVFNVNSAELIKENVGEIELVGDRTSWDLIEGCPSLEWDYIDEGRPRPAKPELNGSPVMVRQRNPELSDTQFEAMDDRRPEKWVMVEADWDAPPPPPRRRHKFPIAEDLLAVDGQLVTNFTGNDEDHRVDLRDMVGVLWDAVDMLIKRTRLYEDRLVLSVSGRTAAPLPPRPQKGDLIEGVGAKVPGRTRRVIDPTTGQVQRRPRRKRG